MVAEPALMPRTVGTRFDGLVALAAIEKFEGDAATTAELLLARVMDTPPAPATVPNMTGKFTVLPAVIVTPEGRRMPPAAGWVTVTRAAAVATLVAVAVIVTDPAATPVTGTDRVVPVPKLIAAGTVATAGLLEVRPTTSPFGSDADSVKVRSWDALPLIVSVAGENAMEIVAPPPVTWTWQLTVAYPLAEAVMVAVPAILPVTAGTWREVAVEPSGMVIVDGKMDATVGSLLVRVMETLPAPAAAPKATGRFAVLPAVTLRLD